VKVKSTPYKNFWAFPRSMTISGMMNISRKRRAVRLVAWIVLVTGLSCTPFAHGAKTGVAFTAQEIAKRVDAHYNRLHSLRVQFIETYAGMGMKRTESGTLLLAKPGRMKWSYSQPAGKLFVIDGKYGYSYTPGDAQAERYPAKQLQDFRSPLRFLLGHTSIQKELTGLTLSQDGSNYRLRGVPRDMEQRVSEVDLTVTADGTIMAIQWKEIDGANTEFHLTDEQANPALPSGAFSFQPPAGVVVVRGLAPI
jgi:outer membrane lipoprotein carrier protein